MGIWTKQREERQWEALDALLSLNEQIDEQLANLKSKDPKKFFEAKHKLPILRKYAKIMDNTLSYYLYLNS